MSLDESVDLSKSVELAEEEKRQVEERAEEITKLINAIDELLVSANITWMEWHDIVGAFNRRNETVIPNITLKEIKERYDKHTNG